MYDASKIPAQAVSRRAALRRLALAGGGGVALATTVLANVARAEDSKLPKSAVGYQESPQGAQACENCSQFVRPASCKVVAGNISPGAWCKVYAKNPA